MENTMPEGETMPRKGYTCITISEDLRDKLRASAKQHNVSKPELLEQWCGQERTSTVLVQQSQTITNDSYLKSLENASLGERATL